METSDNERIILVEEESKEIYEIKLRDEEYDEESRTYKEEDQLLDSYEERIEDTIEEEYMLTEPEDILGDDKVNHKINDNQFEMYDMEAEHEEEADEVQPVTQQNIEIQPQEAPTAVTSPAKNIVDPDERYLMSCLPAFKRFTPQQKAFVRMGIERLFYEVEFENVSESKNKKSRFS